MTSKLIQIIPLLILTCCTVSIPLSTSDTTTENVKTEAEIKKEEALNVQKVQAEQKARQAEESKNPEAKSSEDKGGGLI